MAYSVCHSLQTLSGVHTVKCLACFSYQLIDHGINWRQRSRIFPVHADIVLKVADYDFAVFGLFFSNLKQSA
jgi:hypothetical protein